MMGRRYIAGLCLVALWLSPAHGADDASDWAPDFRGGEAIGVPDHPALVEVSGMAASRKYPGVLWMHNDSGGGPLVYAVMETGEHLATVSLPAAKALDWEDMAIGPGDGDGEWFIYVGDIGNNARLKKQFSVVRFSEPDLDLAARGVSITIASIDRLVFTYPNPEEKVYDCEALLVDPLTSELYFATKGRGKDNGRAYVFRATPPFQKFRVNTVEQVDRFRLGEEIKDQVTGGDVSPDGRWIIMRSYTRGRIWQRPEGGSLVDAFKSDREPIPVKNEPQGEAIAFASDGKSYYTTSEENLEDVPEKPGPQVIYRYNLKEPEEP